MIYTLGERQPELADSVFVAPNATLVGAVNVEKEASIWFQVVIRAEHEPIHIGAGSNIQDAAVLHVDPGFPLQIGSQVTVGHKAILHGCSIGDASLIGMNAVVLNGARIGSGCLIGANALVTEGMEIPDGSLVLGSPAKIKTQLSQEQQLALMHNADHYVGNARRFCTELKEQE